MHTTPRHARSMAIWILKDTIGMGAGERYGSSGPSTDAGYAMAGLLVAIAIMGIVMSMIMPTWRTWAKREREAELIFRGEQYMRAIELYQRRFAGTYPTDMQALVDQRFLRKAYTDPMTQGGEFQVLTQASAGAAAVQAPAVDGMRGATSSQPFGDVTPVDQDTGTGSSPTPFTEAARGMSEGGGGIIGVVSTSTDTSMREYNGRTRYDEWLFVYLPQAAQPGLAPGVPGGIRGQGGAGRPGPGGAAGAFGNITGQPDSDARGRGGRGGQGQGGRQRPGSGVGPGAPPGC